MKIGKLINEIHEHNIDVLNKIVNLLFEKVDFGKELEDENELAQEYKWMLHNLCEVYGFSGEFIELIETKVKDGNVQSGDIFESKLSYLYDKFISHGAQACESFPSLEGCMFIELADKMLEVCTDIKISESELSIEKELENPANIPEMEILSPEVLKLYRATLQYQEAFKKLFEVNGKYHYSIYLFLLNCYAALFEIMHFSLLLKSYDFRRYLMGKKNPTEALSNKLTYLLESADRLTSNVAIH